ncbi:uncharacterized protein [Ranitomeya imitator]|uniref:uncharacterized protein n=1 Tax=Ranitomeya imitator TaxID=111125 RepID=UPI0037E78C18
MESLIKTIEKDIDKWENDISELKAKKFARDTADFESDKIFKWQLPKKTKMGGVKHGNLGRDQASCAESSTSCSDADSSNEYQIRTRTNTRDNREGGKKYPDLFTNRKGNRRQNDKPKVINLSTHVLSESQLNVLEKGLTFSPSSHLDKFQVVKDIHLFARKIILQKLHHRNDLNSMDGSDLEMETLRNLEDLLEENESGNVSGGLVFL